MRRRDYSVQPQPTGDDLELLRHHAPRLVFDSMEALRPNRALAFMIVSAYVAVAALLVLGMWQTHVPQHRL